MKNPFPLLVVFLSCSVVGRAQSGEAALAEYQAFLSKLNTVEYQVQRIDTFPGKTIWDNKGQAVIQRDAASQILASRFYVSQQDAAKSYWCDGKTGYWLDDKAKTHEVDAKPYKPSVLGSAAGQMFVEELLTIEPGFESVSTTKTTEGRIIRLHYPDLPKFDELKRYTYLVLDEQTNQPRMVRTVLEKGGAKWSTIKILSDVRINSTLASQTLNGTAFLATYTAAVPDAPRQPSTLTGKSAPSFKVTTYAKAPVQLSNYRGKTVLLDFWTTSCSPCISAMPKMQGLQEQYRKQGLVVVGILMDPGNAERAQGILKRQGAAYTALLGNNGIEKAYGVDIYPRYVLINKNGKVTFDASGFSPQLEPAIKAALIE